MLTKNWSLAWERPCGGTRAEVWRRELREEWRQKGEATELRALGVPDTCSLLEDNH